MILTILLSFASYCHAAITWEKSYGGSQPEEAYSIQQTTDGGYVVIGYSFSFGAGENDLYVIKLDEFVNTLWEKTYGGVSHDMGASIQQITDGYIVGGWTYSFGIGTPSYSNAYIIKLDTSGNKIWGKVYGGSFSDWANSIQQTTDGGLIAAGAISSSVGVVNSDFYIIKLDANGEKIWERAYGGIDADRMPTQGDVEVMVRWIYSALEGKPISIFGNGKQEIDFVHIEDVVRANLLCLTDTSSCHVYNIGSGKATTLLQLHARLENVARKKITVEFKKAQRTNVVRSKIADIKRAKKALRYKPSVPLQKGLQSLYA